MWQALIHRSRNERESMNEALGCSRSCCISVNCRRKNYKRRKGTNCFLSVLPTAHIMFLRFESRIRFSALTLHQNRWETERESERRQIGRERKEIREGRERERSRDTISNCSRSAAKLGRWNDLRIANRAQRPQLRLRTHKYFQVIVIPIVCIKILVETFRY